VPGKETGVPSLAAQPPCTPSLEAVGPWGNSKSAIPPHRVVAFGWVEHLRLLMGGCGMPLQLTQLSPGTMRGDLLPVLLGPVRLLRIRLDRPLLARGAKDPLRQIVCLDLTPPAEAKASRSHGLVLPATAVCGLASHGDIHLSVPAGAEVALMSIERRAFAQWCVDPGL